MFNHTIALAVLAAEAGADLTALTQYGVLGVIAAILIVFARQVHRREVDRADRLEAELNRLNAAMQDKAIPALLTAATAINECTELLRDLQRDRRLEYARRDEER